MKNARILIVEDSELVAKQLTDSLISIGHTCVGVAKTGERAIELANSEDPDLILMDIWLQGDMNGSETAAIISKNSDKPIIFLTSSSDVTLLETLKLSHSSNYMIKPFNAVELQFNIELSLAKAETNRIVKNQKKWQEAILESVIDGVIAEDENGHISYINTPGRTLLEIYDDYIGCKTSEFMEIYRKDTGESVGENPKTGTFECRLVTHKGMQYSVILKVAEIISEDGKLMGRALTMTNITDEIELQGRIHFLTFHDSMTGLYNRNYLDEEIDRLNTSRQLPISIIMADLNGLKIANDLMGHSEGDEIIRMSADVLRNATRAEDIVARVGGDEFLIFLPETDEATAEMISQRIISACSRRATKLGTLSMAVGHYTKYDAFENIRLCITKADEDMYAKKSLMKAKFYENSFNFLYQKMVDHAFEGMKVTTRVRDFMAEMCLLDPVTRPLVKEAVMLSEVYDIGMMCLDEEIYAPKIFTDNDKRTMLRHCETGARIAEMSHHYNRVAKYIPFHHHRYDGRGSSDGVKGDLIPLLARMLFVVDSFVAITSQRQYRDKMNIKQASNEIAKGSGSQFDPWAVDLFFKALNKVGLEDKEE